MKDHVNPHQEHIDKVEAHNRDLRNRAKSVDDLTIPIRYHVLEVNSYPISSTQAQQTLEETTLPKQFEKSSELLELRVNPPDSPYRDTNMIVFPYVIPVFKHDFILASLFKGEIELEKPAMHVYQDGKTAHFVEREFQETETALKIELLSRDDHKIVRAIYHAVPFPK
ncbi:hypothetical protein GOV05_05705 [Candidatus Woesearchaeota archaeon]|nr:hypothetical protein [Candidatus Woesearchaeota archaeon]